LLYKQHSQKKVEKYYQHLQGVFGLKVMTVLGGFMTAMHKVMTVLDGVMTAMHEVMTALDGVMTAMPLFHQKN